MSSNRLVRAIVFDLDGTLADTFPLIVAAWNAAVSPHTGLTYSDADVISRFGIPDPQMIRRDLQGEAAELADAAYHAHYAKAHRELVKPFPGVAELLTELHARQVPLGVMTGKGRKSAKITLEALGWTSTFAAVITGEDVTHQKPDPEGPLAAAGILGVDPTDCAFVGDSPVDMGAGKNARMLTVAAGWHPVYIDAIRKLNPDIWADAPANILRLIAPPR